MKKINRAGSISMEFAILLGVVFMAFMAMNTYMKRGLQGRVREMTDHLISEEQVVEVNTGYTQSNSATGENATLGSEMFQGGGTRINLASNKQYSSSAIYDDNKEIVVSASVIPSEHGQTYHPEWDSINATTGPPLVINQDAVALIQNSTDVADGVTQYSNLTVTLDAQDIEKQLPDINTAEYGAEDASIDNQITQGNFEALQAKKQSLTAQANSLRQAAAKIEAKGQYIMQTASNMHCHKSSCRRARTNMWRQGAAMVYQYYAINYSPNMIDKNAESLRAQAAALDQQVADIDKVIGNPTEPVVEDEGDEVDEH